MKKSSIFTLLAVSSLVITGCGGGSSSSVRPSSSGSSCTYKSQYYGSTTKNNVKMSRRVSCNDYVLTLKNLSNAEKRCIVRGNGIQRTVYLDPRDTKVERFPARTNNSRSFTCKTWNLAEQQFNKESKSGVHYGMRINNGLLKYRFYNRRSYDKRCTVYFKNSDATKTFIVPASGQSRWLYFGDKRTRSYRCKSLL